MSDNTPQLEFLYKSLEDAQSTIRFSDTKAGVIIVASGALSTYLVPLGKAFLDHTKFPFTIYSLFTIGFGLICLGGFLLSLLISLRTINPMTSPDKHILISNLSTNIPFYLYKIEPKPSLLDCVFEKSASKLITDPKQLYENLIADNNSEEIIKSLVLEVCRVSYIREKKIHRVNTAFSFFAIGLIFLLISSLMSHSIQWV